MRRDGNFRVAAQGRALRRWRRGMPGKLGGSAPTKKGKWKRAENKMLAAQWRSTPTVIRCGGREMLRYYFRPDFFSLQFPFLLQQQCTCIATLPVWTLLQCQVPTVMPCPVPQRKQFHTKISAYVVQYDIISIPSATVRLLLLSATTHALLYDVQRCSLFLILKKDKHNCTYHDDAFASISALLLRDAGICNYSTLHHGTVPTQWHCSAHRAATLIYRWGLKALSRMSVISAHPKIPLNEKWTTTTKQKKKKKKNGELVPHPHRKYLPSLSFQQPNSPVSS